MKKKNNTDLPLVAIIYWIIVISIVIFGAVVGILAHFA